MIVITGGAGFIGANLVRCWRASSDEPVLVIDKLTYAGSLDNLGDARSDPRVVFVQADICDAPAVAALLARHQPRAVLHLAAESHVDRSIAGPGEFVRTNTYGTYALLECVRAYWLNLPRERRELFRFVHVSTDEVYGSADTDAPPFTEAAACRPNNPYAASKAGADHLVRAYHVTYGLPAITTRSGNNFGPLQLPEKLIPRMVVDAQAGRRLPVYGDGLHVRDWIYVDDHCRALMVALARGTPGEIYNISARNTRANLDVIRDVCNLIDDSGGAPVRPCRALIEHVANRPGHDRRYAIDPSRAERELLWGARIAFSSALRETVNWYLANPDWVAAARARLASA